MTNVAYMDFLVTGPEGYATNAETAAEALELLTGYLEDFAERLRDLSVQDEETAKKMRAIAKRLRNTDPVTVHWPRNYRFQIAGYQFWDFRAERCRPRGED